jgi:hypothetical protein
MPAVKMGKGFGSETRHLHRARGLSHLLDFISRNRKQQRSSRHVHQKWYGKMEGISAGIKGSAGNKRRERESARCTKVGRAQADPESPNLAKVLTH